MLKISNFNIELGGRLFCVLWPLFGIPMAAGVFSLVASFVIDVFARLATIKQDKVKAAFNLYDDDNSGFLEPGELRAGEEHIH